MNKMNHEILDHAVSDAMFALAGNEPVECNDSYESDYKWREDLKTYCLSCIKGGLPPNMAAPYWIVYCYSHWHRATFNKSKKYYMPFREYLSAWLFSVAPSLKIDKSHIKAICQCTGVNPTKNNRLPFGYSETLPKLYGQLK